MTKLDRLIAELCPDGVEYLTLKEVITITRGVRLVKSQLAKIGEFPVYQNSMSPLGYYYKSNYPANTVFVISAGAAGEVGYSNVDFWAADDCFCLICPNRLHSRYLYHALLYQQNLLMSKVRRASVPRLARSVVEQLKIPLPPISVQREIVRILDNFTELTAELTAELAARKKQYEYYRNLLLTFDENDETILQTDRQVQWPKMSKIVVVQRGTYITKKDTKHGDIPVILGGQEPAYYCDTHNHDGEAIVMSRSGAYAGYVSFWNRPIFVTDGFIFETRDGIRIKYLYYYLKNTQEFLHKMKRGGGVPHVRGNEVMDLKIPVPSLDEQERIITILDSFDALFTDISNGLPAEIAARQKQFEYYRNKLLTFREIS